jgi:uncharacterized membrane protein YqiK
MENLIIYGVIAVAVVIVAIVLINIYVKAPPSYAYILSGIKKEPRVLIGTGGFKIPFLERLDKVYLGQVTVDVKTSVPVPTNDFIDVIVDSCVKVRALPDSAGVRLMAKNFLNISNAAQTTLSIVQASRLLVALHVSSSLTVTSPLMVSVSIFHPSACPQVTSSRFVQSQRKTVIS